MKPTVLEILVASRYTLPLWVLAVSYLYYIVSSNWERADAPTQFAAVGLTVAEIVEPGLAAGWTSD